MKIKILIPVYNDFQSISKLLIDINSVISNLNEVFSIIIVNDGSTEKTEIDISNLDKINSIKVINMKENRGHARCNAAGLKYIFENEEFDYVIPMDGDGEDRPEEIKEFINQIESSNNHPIVGERVKRSEKLIFKICYQLHKLITLTFTGKSIKFGNYTCLPKSTVEKMIKEKATWNSFSGSLKKIENNLLPIPSTRGSRYFGPSKMSYFNLIKHSLSIMSVFRKTFLIRSALFIILYILLIKSNASVVTALPLVFLLIAVYSISNLSLRENLDEFKDCLTQIKDIDNIK